MDNGFKKVRPLHGGLDAWVAAGYTVDTLPVSAVSGSGSVLRGTVIS
jgi:3-mercaptopyruvate sulfurtransferase SseA